MSINLETTLHPLEYKTVWLPLFSPENSSPHGTVSDLILSQGTQVIQAIFLSTTPTQIEISIGLQASVERMSMTSTAIDKILPRIKLAIPAIIR